MGANINKTLLFIVSFLTISEASASFSGNLEMVHQKPTRHSSHSEVMADEDVEAFSKVHENAEVDDINGELRFLEDENRELRKAIAKSMKTRNCRNVCWASFHARFSGIIKGAGILFTTTGVVLTSVNELFVQVNHTPLSISGFVLGIVGGCVLAWSELSKNTGENLDQAIRASIDIQAQQIGLLKKQKKQLLIQQHYELRDQLSNMQAGLERLGDSEQDQSSDGEHTPSVADKGKDTVIDIEQMQEVNL